MIKTSIQSLHKSSVCEIKSWCVSKMVFHSDYELLSSNLLNTYFTVFEVLLETAFPRTATHAPTLRGRRSNKIKLILGKLTSAKIYSSQK